MKQFLLILMLFLTTNKISVTAQQTQSKYKFTSSLGYGTENNWGNTGVFMGLAVNKFLKKKLNLEAGLSYFTTDVYNAYKSNPTFYLNGDRRYNSMFLNLNLQYLLGNESSLIIAKIKIGPSIKYYDTKILTFAKVYNMPENNLYPIVPGTEMYYDKNGVKLALYNGVSFDAKVNENLRLGVFLDVYSSLIPIEHFMPGIHATFKLKGKK